MRGRGILFHGPVNSGEVGDRDLNPKLRGPKHRTQVVGSYPFHITWTLSMSLNCILKFLKEAGGQFPCGNIPRDSTRNGGGITLIGSSPAFPWIFAGKSWGNFRTDDPLKFPHKSVGKTGGRGWLPRWVPKCTNSIDGIYVYFMTKEGMQTIYMDSLLITLSHLPRSNSFITPCVYLHIH